MVSNKQPEALRLADTFDHPLPPEWSDMQAAAAELRRLHAENAELSDQCLQSVLVISTLKDEIGRITGQRDEMLAALQACHEAMGYMSEYDIPLTLPEQVKAALEQPQNHIPDAGNMAPAGWKLVPAEPTDAMLGAGLRHVAGMVSMPSVYRAMLAAAPQPPVVEQEQKFSVQIGTR